MIKTVSGSGRYIVVNGGMPVTTYINNNPGSLGAGNVRWNTNSQNLEVYDGFTWIQVSTNNHASVGLTPEAELLLDWAKEKRNQEMQMEALAKSNPTIADLVEQKKNLDHKIKMVQILIKEEPKVGTN